MFSGFFQSDPDEYEEYAKYQREPITEPVVFNLNSKPHEHLIVVEKDWGGYQHVWLHIKIHLVTENHGYRSQHFELESDQKVGYNKFLVGHF